MLMTVLKSELAISQSKALIRIFKGMKDYISENRVLIGTDDIARLALQTSENTAAIAKMSDEMLRKSDLPKIFKNFAATETGKEFLIMNGQLRLMLHTKGFMQEQRAAFILLMIT